MRRAFKIAFANAVRSAGVSVAMVNSVVIDRRVTVWANVCDGL
jgi:hypothetical protein